MSLLKERWLIWVTSLILGCTFIYSSYHKIADPPDFAKVIYNYHLVPGVLIHPASIYMPWFELLGGLAVLTGIWRRGAAFGFLLMSLLFIAALGFNLYRGHPTVCGCFGTFAAGESWTDAQKFAKMWREILVDVGLVILSLQILYGTACAEAEAQETEEA